MSRKINPKAIAPDDLAAILSAQAGSAFITARLISEHKRRTGEEIGAGKTVDIVRYVAWILYCRARKVPLFHDAPGKESLSYKDERANQAALMRAKRQEGRDIGGLPPVADPQRKADCSRNFGRWCKTYLGLAFNLPWSPGHKRVIKIIQKVVLKSGLFALAMPRGEGKTTLSIAACIWALLYGHRRYIFLIAATGPKAKGKLLAGIKTILQTNPLILADFPEAVFPIHALNRISKRCEGQLCNGAATSIAWGADKVIMPTIPGSLCSGSIIEVDGIAGGKVRGPFHVLESGEIIRPDLLLGDDPQTDKSAKSAEETTTRLKTLDAAAEGMAGPGNDIAGLVTVTVIRKSDMAEQLLDRDARPQWGGERTKALEAWPDKPAMKIWEVYKEMRRDGMRNAEPGEDGTIEATDFYRTNQKAMDKGARVGWPERYNIETQVSALQDCMDSFFDDPETFYAERQNEPKDARDSSLYEMDPKKIAGLVNGMKRFCVPATCQVLTCFIDVGQERLHHAAIGFNADFSCHVADYGQFPRAENQKLWDIDEPTMPLEQAMTAGLNQVLKNISEIEFVKDDGSKIKPDIVLIDCGWSKRNPEDPNAMSTQQVVFNVCRSARMGCPVVASRGRPHRYFKMPQKKETRVFHNAYQDTWKGKGKVIIHNACQWREWTQRAFLLPDGAAGVSRIFGRKDSKHSELAENICSEILREKLFGERTEIYDWAVSGANHYLDCLVGCNVGASVLSLRPGQESVAKKEGKRRKRGGFRSMDS